MFLFKRESLKLVALVLPLLQVSCLSLEKSICEGVEVKDVEGFLGDYEAGEMQFRFYVDSNDRLRADFLIEAEKSLKLFAQVCVREDLMLLETTSAEGKRDYGRVLGIFKISDQVQALSGSDSWWNKVKKLFTSILSRFWKSADESSLWRSRLVIPIGETLEVIPVDKSAAELAPEIKAETYLMMFNNQNLNRNESLEIINKIRDQGSSMKPDTKKNYAQMTYAVIFTKVRDLP